MRTAHGAQPAGGVASRPASASSATARRALDAAARQGPHAITRPEKPESKPAGLHAHSTSPAGAPSPYPATYGLQPAFPRRVADEDMYQRARARSGAGVEYANACEYDEFAQYQKTDKTLRQWRTKRKIEERHTRHA